MRIAAVASLLLARVLIAAVPASAQSLICGQVITQNTKLDSDLVCSYGTLDPNEAALEIGAPDITLDLNGHNVSSDQVGVRNNGFDGVTIRNGHIGTDYPPPLQVTGASWGTLAHLTLNTLAHSAAVTESDHMRIVDNKSQWIPFHFDVDHSTIARTDMGRGWQAWMTVSGSHNRVVDNTTGGAGIYFYVDHSRVARNHIVNDIVGTTVKDSDDNAFVDNVIVGSPYGANAPTFQLENSSRNLFRNNKLFRARTELISGTANVFRDNVAFGSPVDGFHVPSGMTGTRLIGNLAVANGDDGFDVEAPGTRMRDNTADKNTDLGIEASAGVIDRGGNTASGNGNPLQCTGVFCG
jgi:Periplasmic copper-binding protein (NosD)